MELTFAAIFLSELKGWRDDRYFHSVNPTDNYNCNKNIIIRYCKIKIKKVIGTEKEENIVCFCNGKLGRRRTGTS